MKFRKKPVVIEAQQFAGDEAQMESVACWCDGALARSGGGDWCCYIDSLEGEMRASYGDWIIKGVKGEFYPCKPDIFAATYEPADDKTQP